VPGSPDLVLAGRALPRPPGHMDTNKIGFRLQNEALDS
jgi:hypothetical protein